MLSNEEQILLSLLAGSALKFATFGLLSCIKRREFVGHVSRLFVYPGKSMRELPGEIKAVQLTKYGIFNNKVGDRYRV